MKEIDNLIKKYEAEIEDLKNFTTDSAYTAKKIFTEVVKDLKKYTTMKDKDIIDNAVLIARFEGYEAENESTYGNIFYSEDNERTALDTAYHNSWNWLMPVVSKISDEKHWSLNATLEWLSENQDRDGLYSIEDVYQAVVEYIKS